MRVDTPDVIRKRIQTAQSDVGALEHRQTLILCALQNLATRGVPVARIETGGLVNNATAETLDVLRQLLTTHVGHRSAQRG